MTDGRLLVAHNAFFDMSVLRKSAAHHRYRPPPVESQIGGPNRPRRAPGMRHCQSPGSSASAAVRESCQHLCAAPARRQIQQRPAQPFRAGARVRCDNSQRGRGSRSATVSERRVCLPRLWRATTRPGNGEADPAAKRVSHTRTPGAVRWGRRRSVPLVGFWLGLRGRVCPKHKTLAALARSVPRTDQTRRTWRPADAADRPRTGLRRL